jgi:hypothetical protein
MDMLLVRVPYEAFQACMAFGGWFGYRFMAGLACKLAPSRRLAQHDAGVLVGCRTGLQGGGGMFSHGQKELRVEHGKRGMKQLDGFSLRSFPLTFMQGWTKSSLSWLGGSVQKCSDWTHLSFKMKMT